MRYARGPILIYIGAPLELVPGERRVRVETITESLLRIFKVVLVTSDAETHIALLHRPAGVLRRLHRVVARRAEARRVARNSFDERIRAISTCPLCPDWVLSSNSSFPTRLRVSPGRCRRAAPPRGPCPVTRGLHNASRSPTVDVSPLPIMSTTYMIAQ